MALLTEIYYDYKRSVSNFILHAGLCNDSFVLHAMMFNVLIVRGRVNERDRQRLASLATPPTPL